MEELDLVELNQDCKDLKKGTLETIVLGHDEKDFEVEFFDEGKNTIDVYTINVSFLDKR